MRLLSDRHSVDLPGVARHGQNADSGHGRRADRSDPAWRAVATAAVALVGLTAACGSAVGQPPSRIPARASLFRAIPAACSLIDAKTASLLGLNAKGRQPLPTARDPGLTEEYCDWVSDPGDSSGPSPSPSGLIGPSSSSLFVIGDLFTAAAGQGPAAAAQSQLHESVSEQEQADHSRPKPVAGLADGAFIEYVARADIHQSQLQARDQNVLVTVAYTGDGSEASINGKALTAARAILAALAAS
jgi:hypothetical protein